MDKHGKKTNILFEPASVIDNVTGERIIAEFGCILWSEPELKELIIKIPGVVQVNTTYNKFQYLISFDPRYDVEFVKKEIEAEIICKIGEVESANK